MGSSGPELNDGPRHSSELDHQIGLARVQLLAEQSTGAATSTIVGALLIAVVLASDVRAVQIVAWTLAYIVPAAWRIRYSRQLLRGQHPPDARALRVYLGVAIYNGVWTGALPLLFFAHLSIEARVALTVVTLLALTAGASTYASYRIGYLWALALSMLPLALMWALFGGARSWIVVVTLLVFGILMVRLSRYFGEVFARSVEIRFEREQVVAQLRREKQLTELARQAAEDANRAKSRFLANASHDLRQPAHALGLFTEVLEATAQTQQHRDIARHIAAATQLLGDLLESLLDISRLDAGIVTVHPQPIEVRPLLERLRAETEGLVQGRPIAVTAQSDDLTVSLDRAHVERSLRNLLDNAIKFTTRGHIRISAHARGDQLAFCVQDSGRGIPLEFQKLVFEEFYQVGNAERDRRKGLGLGLSIVSRLASLMGGTIVVDSQPGVGTTFTMRVPLIRATEQVSNSDRPAPDKPDLSGWQVLVIDDEEIVRKGMSALLSSWGASVAQADGLQQVRSLGSAALGAMRRLCLCDLRLRNGEDGIETAQVLRGENPQLRILLITGDTAAHRIEQATQSGLPLLHKPVTPAQLARAIRHATQP